MTDNEFDLKFYKMLARGIKGEEAFWILNREYEEKYGKLRHATYGSYRACKCIRMRNGRK